MQGRKINLNVESPVVLIIAVLIAVVMLVSYIVALSKFSGPSFESVESEVSSEADVVSEEISEESVYEVSVPDDGYEYYGDFRFENIEVNNSDVTSGTLAIIKAKTPAPSVSDSDLVSIGKTKRGSYGLKDYSIALRGDVIAEIDSFIAAFTQEVPDNKIGIGEAYIPKNGDISEDDITVELCTGYSFQFAIYNSSDSLTDSKYAYLYEQASKFGFIQRFPANKVSSTGFELDYKTYRYVGVVHSSYMRHYNYSLEEYVDKIKTEKVIERKPDNGSSNAYVMYYVAKNENSTTTSIPVPSGYEYEISGDGSDGFIITVTVPV